MPPRGVRNIRQVPRRRNEILKAQENYLATDDPKYIEELYTNFVRLGMFILHRRKQYQDDEEILDIASDLCVRLMERKVPILLCAPSAYIKAALFYKLKPRKDTELEALDRENKGQELESVSFWDYMDRLRDHPLLEGEDEVSVLARLTIDSRVSWRSVYNNLEDKQFRKDYKVRMKEIEQCVRSSANSRGASEQ